MKVEAERNARYKTTYVPRITSQEVTKTAPVCKIIPPKGAFRTGDSDGAKKVKWSDNLCLKLVWERLRYLVPTDFPREVGLSLN